jgi:hypothetical protein
MLPPPFFPRIILARVSLKEKVEGILMGEVMMVAQEGLQKDLLFW